MHNQELLNQFYDHLKSWIPYYLVVFIVLEGLFMLFRLHKLYYKEMFVNLLTGGFAIVIGVLIKSYFFTNLYPYVYTHRLWTIESNWVAWVLGFLLYTFIQFGTHFIYHKVRIFWCLHEVHHSAIHMNTTTGVRTSIFDIVSLDLLYLAIPFFGIDPIVYFILYALNKFWGTFIHINENIVCKIPYLEKILVTPEIHHIHHASNICYLDKNYGEVVPWFDKIFKTFMPKKEKPIYGTLKIQREIGFWETQLHEFQSLWADVQSTSNWKEKFNYFWKPPGWEPNNVKNTVRYLQKKGEAIV